MKNEEQKHFLSLMFRVGDYAYIDISVLDIAGGYRPNRLEDIDSFTMHFTKEEIMAAIKRSNVVNDKYLSGQLVIADNQKHKPIRVIDKNYYNNFRIDLYLKEKMQNKQEINNIFNKFKSICLEEKTNNDFHKALLDNNLDLAIDILFNLPYLKLRKFIVYLLDMRNLELIKKNNKELVRDKLA